MMMLVMKAQLGHTERGGCWLFGGLVINKKYIFIWRIIRKYRNLLLKMRQWPN